MPICLNLGEKMILIKELRTLKYEIRSLCSAVAILKDAVSNGLGMSNFGNIQDNINMLFDKVDNTNKIYMSLSEEVCGTEDWVEISLLLQEIKSLFVILKYSLKSKRTEVAIDDIFNCLNVIFKYLQETLAHAVKIVKMYPEDNVYQI